MPRRAPSIDAEQETNETRIAELEDRLARAEVIDVSKLSGDTIKFGATVTLIDEDTGEKRVWQIVGEPEAGHGPPAADGDLIRNLGINDAESV